MAYATKPVPVIAPVLTDFSTALKAVMEPAFETVAGDEALNQVKGYDWNAAALELTTHLRDAGVMVSKIDETVEESFSPVLRAFYNNMSEDDAAKIDWDHETKRLIGLAGAEGIAFGRYETAR